ncbi:MAG: hypothetical protein P8P52_05640 [Opitutae bacterium]|nr:hypothetical protein [Opitutae bacterium]
MNIIKKLIGASALAVMIAISAADLSAQREPDIGKNFTISDSPETTVFNLKHPSVNRHIHDYRAHQPAPAAPAAAAPVDDCAPGLVADSIDQYAVSLNKSAPATVALNEPYAYSYMVNAKHDLKRVVVQEQIPAGTVYISSNPQAEVSGSNVTWTLYNLANGTQTPIELVVKATSVTELSSCATITSYQDTCTITAVGVPELAIVKTTPYQQVLVNTGVPWDITVTNSGNFCAYDVVVTDTLPAGVVHESGNSQLVAELGTLAPGESRDIIVNTTAAATGEHCNLAVASSSNAGSVQDDACVKVVEAGLEVTKAGTAMQFVGKQASYQIVLRNTGDVLLNDVVVKDTVPAQNKLLAAPAAQINGNTATWSTSLDAGESKSFDVTVLGLEEGTYCNQVSAASAAYGLRGADDACTEWRGYPALLIEVIDTEDPLLVGEETTYVIQITNQGTAADTNVGLQIQLPSELSVVSAAGDSIGTISENNVNFAPYAILNAKEIIQFRVVAKAVSVGDARFRAQMSSDMLKSPVPEEEATQVY